MSSRIPDFRVHGVGPVLRITCLSLFDNYRIFGPPFNFTVHLFFLSLCPSPLKRYPPPFPFSTSILLNLILLLLPVLYLFSSFCFLLLSACFPLYVVPFITRSRSIQNSRRLLGLPIRYRCVNSLCAFQLPVASANPIVADILGLTSQGRPIVCRLAQDVGDTG